MIARLAVMATAAYLYGSAREWHALYQSSLGRIAELQRLLDHERAEVDRLAEEAAKMHLAAIQERHLRDEIEALEVAVKVLASDAATAQQIARTTTALAETKLDALADELRQRREPTGCDFCNKTRETATLLVKGRTAMICDGCSAEVQAIMAEELTKRYHIERINAAESGDRTIRETLCPTCHAVDVPCFAEDAPTVDHG